MTTDPTVSAPAVSAPAEVALRDLATADSLLLALDFDGVLAPLQDDPSTSRMVPESAAAIAALARLPHTRVALVSGRDIATLRQLSQAPDGAWLIGSHGAEAELEGGAHGASAPVVRSPELTPAEAEMLTAIDAHLDAFEHTLPGGHGTSDFLIEAKPYSRTVHTRGIAAEAAAALHGHATEVVEEFPDIRVIEGHDITELAVKQATKGDGIRLLARAGEPTAMGYLGDDVTDEDAFAALDELTDSRALDSGLTLKVGSAQTCASWRIADPTAVAALLDRLAAERTEFLRSVDS
ncbi:trehalose 6-phosphatase [Brevibacterium siliguriense]|uniref:Trehalose 6-phosphate phosphatase n=1 Tax=Brevibacterium siliguriense TaxID=1136497 RepID=A0A1H1PUR9_9MICO|nr:trehalose-phosphatase [Brevibacterium siliguriense]SDS14479.1 trehalose 6-phosphatase [Brevibacterium siliguriense]